MEKTEEMEEPPNSIWGNTDNTPENIGGCEDEFDQDDTSSMKEELMLYIQEAQRSLNDKIVLQKRNYTACSQRGTVVGDCSVKKNSSFIKKLRNFGAAQIGLLVKECQSLNLSRYLSEVAVAIVEAKIKFTDIPAATLICTELNCAYADFAPFLQEEFIKILAISKDELILNAARLKVELCLYAELSLVGVIHARQSLPILGTVLTTLAADKTFSTLSLLLSFTKHCGPDFAGLVPRRIRLLCDKFNTAVERKSLLGSSKQENVRNLLNGYYSSLCQHLEKEQDKLLEYEKQSRQIIISKGEVRPDRIKKAQNMRTEIQTLFTGAINFSELLDIDLPNLLSRELQQGSLVDTEDGSEMQVWDSEDTRVFYTQLPDVQAYLQQLSTKQLDEKEPDIVKISDTNNSSDPDIMIKKSDLDSFLKLLPECHSKAMIDNAALEFLLFFNYKTGRKRLVTTLFTVPRTKMGVLPFYARFVAIIKSVIPDIAETLCQQLRGELGRHIRKKDQVNIDNKKKTVKFIGELVNFNVYPKKDVLRSLKSLLFDFTHHNVEMTCSLLETCGRVLYAASDCHDNVKYHLEQMLRLKVMMTLDVRYVAMIENTYYHIVPPDTTSTPAPVQLTPMQMFIQQLIFKDLLEPKSEETVLDRLRSLDWESGETAGYTVLCLTSAFRLCFTRIRALASLLCALADYQEDAVCRVVDGVLEDIRVGMELNMVHIKQRRVAMVMYLGELYNYRLLDTSDILKVLYSLISFGVSPESSLDPASSVMRLHLTLLLLSTCLFSLCNTDFATKLHYFFIFFQHYYWMKRSSSVWTGDRPFPRDIIHRFEDVLEMIGLKFTLAGSLDEANNAVQNLLLQLRSTTANNNPNIDSWLSTVYEDDELTDEEEDELANTEEPLLTRPILHPKLKKKEDSDDEFLQEFNNMISESVKVTEGNKTKPNTDIAVPLNYKRLSTDGERQFVLLLKKGNKPTCKSLCLPADHEFFTELKTREEACRKEIENVKRLTLDKNELLQEDL